MELSLLWTELRLYMPTARMVEHLHREFDLLYTELSGGD